jgi:2-keto-3-deoxy-L-rhamnonate aldolase
VLALKADTVTSARLMRSNFPAVAAGIDLDSDTLLALSAHPNIVGCKLTCGNMGKLTRIAAKRTPDEFIVYAGKSDHFAHSLAGGGGGLITGLGNLFPKVHADLWRRWHKGDMKGVKELQFALAEADAANVKLETSEWVGEKGR